MIKQYWGSVRQRIVSLGNTVVNSTTPVLINYAVDKTCRIIESKIKHMYINSFVYSGVFFILNFIGLWIFRHNSIGELTYFVATCFFSVALIIWLVRACLFIRRYGNISVEITRHIVKEMSVSKGIESYTLELYPILTMTYAGIDLFSTKLPALKTIPRIADFVRYLVKKFWKRLALYVCSIFTYTMFLCFIKIYIA